MEKTNMPNPIAAGNNNSNQNSLGHSSLVCQPKWVEYVRPFFTQ